MKPYHSPAYDDSIRYAVKRASESDIHHCFTVYQNGDSMVVRPSKDAAPAGHSVVAIAQKWDDNTVQLRFDGAWSEFVRI